MFIKQRETPKAHPMNGVGRSLLLRPSSLGRPPKTLLLLQLPELLISTTFLNIKTTLSFDTAVIKAEAAQKTQLTATHTIQDGTDCADGCKALDSHAVPHSLADESLPTRFSSRHSDN